MCRTATVTIGFLMGLALLAPHETQAAKNLPCEAEVLDAYGYYLTINKQQAIEIRLQTRPEVQILAVKVYWNSIDGEHFWAADAAIDKNAKGNWSMAHLKTDSYLGHSINGGHLNLHVFVLCIQNGRPVWKDIGTVDVGRGAVVG